MRSTSRQINIARLNELADLLDIVEAEGQYYDQFYYFRRCDDDDEEHPCGTPSCALGHYAVAHPERWENYEGMPSLREGPLPVRHGLYGAAIEFGLTDEQSTELFGSYGCGEAKTAGQAAAYIRRFIDRVTRPSGEESFPEVLPASI